MAGLHQIGLKAEVTPGTAVTVDRFYEFTSEDLTFNKEFITSAGIRSGRRTPSTRKAGREGVEGTLEMELVNKGMGLLFSHALGTVATTTPGGATTARQHFVKEATTVGKSLTVQKGVEDYAATAQPFTYRGVKITGFELSCENDGIPTISWGIDGWTETTATALATASYMSDIEPYVFTEGALTIDGGTAGTVKAATISQETPLMTDRYGLGSGVKAQQVESGEFRTYGGSLTVEFSGLTAYQRYAAQTQFAVALTFTSPTEIESGTPYSITVEMPICEADGSTPTADGPGTPDLEIPFTALDGDADGPLQVTIIDDQTTA